MRTLGLVYGSLLTGGIQRGASFQIPMMRSWGYRIVVLTARPPSAEDVIIPGLDRRICIGAVTPSERRRKMREAIRLEHIDMIIHHTPYDAVMLSADIAGAKDEGVPAVVFWHSVFSHFYLRKHRQMTARAVFDAIREATAMITLTTTDEAFFRMLGIPSLAIRYADADLMSGFRRERHSHKILWMGRFMELKRPIDAMRIFARVRARIPDAELVVLGGCNEPQYGEDPIQYLALHPEVASAVHLEGFQRDVRPYLEDCGVGLLTSRFEGYCHSLVEMKMASMPVVAYEMPYLDTLKPGSGVVTVPQGDINAAADAIIGLFEDPVELRHQGELARASYREIVSVDQHEAYGRLFSAIQEKNLDGLRTIDSAAAGNVVRTFVEHMDWALRLMDQTVREEWARDRAYCLGRILTWPYRKLKGFLR